MALNIWTGLGRLCYEPELKKTQSGKTVVSLRLAVERDIKKEGEPTADFFSAVAFDKTAEFICKYFHKGDAIIITGSVQNDDYTDKEGNKTIKELQNSYDAMIESICNRALNAQQFINELKQQVTEIVSEVMADNTNRRVTVLTDAELKKIKSPKKQ